MEAGQSTSPVPVSWDLVFTKVHGAYSGRETESSADKTKCGIGGSTLYGYNSIVKGEVRVGDVVFTISHTPRYRAYGAGSWGCDLPNGAPAIEHPWSWMWLSVPGASPAEDVGVVIGDARFAAPAVGPIYGGYAMIGLPGGEVHSSRFANLRDGVALTIPLLGSSSDGYMSSFTVERAGWVEYSDKFGKASIPLNQTFTIETRAMRTVITCTSKLEQYFRAPILMQKNGRPRLYSDFRAVGVRMHLQIFNKTRLPSQGFNMLTQRPVPGQIVLTPIVDKVVHATNALEFAYEAPVDVDLDYLQHKGITKLNDAARVYKEQQALKEKEREKEEEEKRKASAAADASAAVETPAPAEHVVAVSAPAPAPAPAPPAPPASAPASAPPASVTETATSTSTSVEAAEEDAASAAAASAAADAALEAQNLVDRAAEQARIAQKKAQEEAGQRVLQELQEEVKRQAERIEAESQARKRAEEERIAKLQEDTRRREAARAKAAALEVQSAAERAQQMKAKLAAFRAQERAREEAMKEAVKKAEAEARAKEEALAAEAAKEAARLEEENAKRIAEGIKRAQEDAAARARAILEEERLREEYRLLAAREEAARALEEDRQRAEAKREEMKAAEAEARRLEHIKHLEELRAKRLAEQERETEQRIAEEERLGIKPPTGETPERKRILEERAMAAAAAAAAAQAGAKTEL